MNPANSSNGANGQQASAGFGADDVIYTLFRHKWLILAFVCLGLIGAFAVRLVRPPLYLSQAKLKVHYVVTRDMTPSTLGSPPAVPVDASGKNVISDEVEILKSMDVAVSVADAIGPARILAKKGGGNDRMSAAGVISTGIQVEPPTSSILAVSFKHPDREIVKPVLEAVLLAYMSKHQDVFETPNGWLLQKRDQLSAKLTETEKKLKDLKISSNILFPQDASRTYAKEIAKVREDLLEAQRALFEQEELLGGSASGLAGQTNGAYKTVPADDLSSYTFATTRLEELKRELQELTLKYTLAYPLVQNVQGRIEVLTRQKTDFEGRYPSLRQLAVAAAHGATNAVGIEVLKAKTIALSQVLSNLQTQASQAMELEPKVAELERRRAEELKNYEWVINRLEQQEGAQSHVAGSISMSHVQSPTPPRLDYKKMVKQIGIVLVGCIGLGLGLAFLIDLFLDRSIKRASDVERHLHLPVFLSIPDTSSGGWLRLPRWLSRMTRAANGGPTGAGSNGESHSQTALTAWNPAQHLQAYTDGLRERVLSYFEVHNLNLKKPKMVAVTGCDSGAGVSTLASGLAAALSKTGDGNVLLVDMNVDQGVAHSFYKGKPGCGITAALEPENRVGAQVEENLYLAKLNNGNEDALVKVLPTRFNHLMPRLKASDYDYIIFDMPPVNQTSATPRLASYMDLALLVIESEKTRQHSASRASALMREARANVAAVLNKHRSHVPEALSQEA